VPVRIAAPFRTHRSVGLNRPMVALAIALVGPTAAGPAETASAERTATSTPTATTTPGARPDAVVGGPRLAGAGLALDRPAGVPAPPRFAARSWVLADLSTGEVLAARGAHRRGLPASTLKTLTTLTALPLVDPDTRVTARTTDIVDGSQVGLKPGSSYTVRQLLHGTMLASGNDAATALARATGGVGGVGGVERHVARMQAEAVALGARDTVVRNPTGLDAPGQVTSAYDLALIARAAMARSDLRALVATRKVSFPGKEARAGGRRPTYQIQNHNRLLANYPGAIGVKNGFTDRARWTSIGAVTRGGRTYLLTALRRGDGSWRADAAVLDWAFRYGTRVRPVGRLVDRGDPAVVSPSTQTDPPPPAGGAGETARLAAADQPQSPASAGSDPSRTAVGVVGVLAGVCAAVLLALRLRVLRRRPRRQVAADRR
jgi:serine-type D-Ala-D-Ala carboxypeptidase (penicillin-binding protein 5/6)